jgi:hypothetical protein
MRFSDLMGSGGDRPSKRSNGTESDIVIADAIAPYLDERAAPPVAPPESVVEPVEVAAASEPLATLAPDLPAQPAPPTPVASFGVATPLDPEPPRRAWQPDRPVATPATPGAPVDATPAPAPTPRSTATIVADFTPMSDDLLPRRR